MDPLYNTFPPNYRSSNTNVSESPLERDNAEESDMGV